MPTPGSTRLLLIALLCSLASVAASAQNFTFESLSNAIGGYAVGGPLVPGFNGHLYGTAGDGGTVSGYCPGGNVGCGTIFEASLTGKLSLVYSFCSLPSCADGEGPQSGLILGADGNFYGTTLGGGVNGFLNSFDYSGGTVFKISQSGELTTLYSFCSQVNEYGVCLDGAWPYGLVQGTDGNFYGITSQGGSAGQGLNCYNPYGNLYGCGTVFKITPTGKLTTLYSFCPVLNSNQVCPDGESPLTSLVQAGDGGFYGTTPVGGNSICEGFGCGTIFQITPSGTFSTVYNFCVNGGGCTADGLEPGNLVPAANGRLYGIASYGGSLGGGTVFQINKSGTLTTLYDFCNVYPNGNPCPDGSVPSSLMQATDGNFYGTTLRGGATCFFNGSYGCGTVFEVTPAGAITILHSFCVTNCNDGTNPVATLAQGTDGALYGLTEEGGKNLSGCDGGCGTIFQDSTGLGPFVEDSPSFGKAGAVIAILGNNLTTATRVTFNGILAKFSVVSGTVLRATVPKDATTGYVTVTTSSGRLTSNVPFEVLE